MRLAPLILAFALVACATDRHDDAPPPPPAQPMAITGVNRLIHWTAAGDSAAVAVSPFDLYLEADLPDGSVVPATLADDGSFSIAAAPTGAYWLRLVEGRTSREDVYLYTDATTIDLGRDRVGNDRRWELQFGVADVAEVATLIVPAAVTSVRLPDHLLESGERYLIRIAAIAQPGVDVRTRSLYALGLPYGYADLISNTFSVMNSNPE